MDRQGFLLLWSIFCIGFVRIQCEETFLQDDAQRFTFKGTKIADWKQLPFNEPITQVVSAHVDEFYILGATSLWAMGVDGNFYQIMVQNATISNQTRISIISVNNIDKKIPQILLSDPNGLHVCKIFRSAQQKSSISATCQSIVASIGPIKDLIVTNSGTVWIGSKKGLFYSVYAEGKLSAVVQVKEVTDAVNAVAYDEVNEVIVAGTDNFLWRIVKSKWHFFRVPGIIDGPITAMAFDKESTLWIGNMYCINQQHPNLTFTRLDGLGGLPYYNITSLEVTDDGAVWIGSLEGGMRYFEGNWKYYYGPRWLPSTDFKQGQHIVSIAKSYTDPMAALLATDLGLSLVRFAKWTLSKKADHYQKMIYPRHDRYGLVADVSLQSFGDLSTYQQESNDNDGLWTSIYVASQSFRYAVTKDPKAKQDAWKSFEALEFLNNVTGIKGLMARSVLNQTAAPNSGTWHNSTVYKGWIWKGDTSSDEVVGHLFVYPLVHALVAETPAEKARVERLIFDITHYIVKNGFYLIDVTGQPTTWGRWAPEYLNDNPKWYDERGVNSMQILAWLLSAYSITKNETFIDAYNELVNKYDYDINIINLKITQPSDDNYSDDELTFLPYFTYMWSRRPELNQEFQLSIDRTWNIVKPGNSSLWSFIYGATGNEDFGLEGAIRTLKEWPLSQIDWPTQNSLRKDIFLDPNANRSGGKDALELLPWDERTMLRWNGDPFTLDGGSGYSECDPSAWLISYWMGRYLQFIL